MKPAEILRDFSLAAQSRQASLIGRREVLSGRGKFGIFGDGKEIAQIAMAKAFKPGDFRAGYYRDQTFMLAVGATTIDQFFAQLYANADVTVEPHSAGRQMIAHYATRSLDNNGRFKDLTQMVNSAADLSPTASQMPKLVGLGYASRLYRELDELQHLAQFSRQGNEVIFGTIGNASCAEGMFWESVNAIGVLNAPVVLSIWDDGYGISVPNKHQITKEDLSELLSGFQRDPDGDSGFDIYTVKGWDYPALVETYARAVENAREKHIPAIIHVIEMTQPQGHSTSGSHERYKSDERLHFEEAYDCITQLRQWIIEQKIATAGELDQIIRNARKQVEHTRTKAWTAYSRPFFDERKKLVQLIDQLANQLSDSEPVHQIRQTLMAKKTPIAKDLVGAAQQVLVHSRHEPLAVRQPLIEWRKAYLAREQEKYGRFLYSESAEAAQYVPHIQPQMTKNSQTLRGFEILNKVFDHFLQRDPRVILFGEDVGKLGGVNQAAAGLQDRYGELRVSDTGIREATIIGQAIGMAMRGLRPIAEIQYLDYMLYALQILSDDLATLHWRTAGGQKAPLIVRTRGHRLEGIWHAGSPMASLIHLLRGMHITVPRNMVQAAGFYNTLLQSDEPGMVVEVLNGYRLKETLPDNIGEYTIPLGVPEVLREGEDITIVTYGAMCAVAMNTAVQLAEVGIDAEVIDVQTLLPFDTQGVILASLKKTSRILFTDEDAPGGTTAYMMQQIIEEQEGFYWLDSEPRTLAAQPHRPAYGTDGSYFSKPNEETLFTAVYDIMHEVDPTRYPLFDQ